METIIKLLESNLPVALIVIFGVVPLYVKLGIIGKNGSGKNGTSQEDLNNNFRSDIKELYGHADVANKEMANIEKTLAVIDTRMEIMQEDIKEIKNKL